DMPEACRKAVEALNSDAPPAPTSIEEAYSSYYETATRTATGGGRGLCVGHEYPRLAAP
ncbi:hypothetical protein IMZ48_27845, partial [Candidatus Bathyarchaeota archaeon]|nr:hypothetical protein [Candidatus Bathyarchaeota archaeon]